ncbi:putative glycine-rich RNA-binding protein 4 [Paratrimastix pyriformis]|uniref:Glycine-rich RNA-binding protein 4 n=1 Tax=Paratrimastix pyriformis TaxID=342808 RepID=A0ABQ8USQ6_9EUKA|nr:putative glycine-rich RNA-binding protein 4 [Paratrimastix pyriformis]
MNTLFPNFVQQSGEQILDFTRLFVGGLAWETTSESLRRAFAEFGEVISARIITDPFSGKSKGFGFIKFSAPECAARALRMHNQVLDGRNIRVCYAYQERGPLATLSPPSRSLSQSFLPQFVAPAPPAPVQWPQNVPLPLALFQPQVPTTLPIWFVVPRS